ncbi:DUF2384 domain-containing protein (plasmid) [Vibrio sp. SS-MA-C1-2]|uniref:antitoxin Xre/MbcA/ParS toxin-binding domain-containing protein n=1 Tax=Vibrio sp. SS-MA-C1-2 TaxID=2908646 RepID=UPI001F1CA5A4|nr:antitoxin Xre/MbcA/ParS toxin-binding domain-containing protein [Vibrio sp. SS-MA-C1-2]UJF20334.1 DUF2384 domain-containing protein [Vibrio sp. SS-MA-C1-2]
MAGVIKLSQFELLKKWFNWDVKNDLDFSKISKQGVNPDCISFLIGHGFSKKELEWIIPPRTLTHRIKKKEQLSRDESSKVIRTAKIMAEATIVFGNEEKALRWFSKPKKQLDGLSPKEAIHDEFGAQIVSQLLNRIDHGYF